MTNPTVVYDVKTVFKNLDGVYEKSFTIHKVQIFAFSPN